MLTGGRIADRLHDHGVVAARPLVAAVAVLLAAILFVPALLTSLLAVAIPLLFLAAWAIGTLNPPADAARLDILHPRLWGRGEGVRSVLSAAAESGAPLLFGWLSDTLAGGGHAGLRGRIPAGGGSSGNLPVCSAGAPQRAPALPAVG